MTIVSGVRIVRAPCCGNNYVLPNYRSMNFSAFEYWTDGWSDGALMPVGEGIRSCRCGSLFLTRECELVEVVETSEFLSPEWASPEDFRKHMSKNVDANLMLAMRLDFWRYLNHPYRENYRAHRENEEANIKAEWLSANPDTRTWLDKLRGKQAPVYLRPSGVPITFPFCEVSDEQLENMEKLVGLILEKNGEDCNYLLLAELYREQGNFKKAMDYLSIVKSDGNPTLLNVIRGAINERKSMPIRFRY